MAQAKRDWLLLGAAVLLTTLIALPVLTYPLGRDQGEFATIGRGILQGRIPYVELWNPKPPVVFYVYALAMALLGQTAPALRAIDLLIAPIISVALYWLGNRVANPRVGLWAALLFPVFYFTETFWTLTQNDGIAALPMTLAVVCTFKAGDTAWTGGRRAAQWAFAAGALTAYTVWFKYPFALFAIVPLVGYAFGGQRIMGYGGVDAQGRNFFSERRYPYPFRLVLAFLLGGLLVTLGGVVILAAQGAWDDLIESAQVTAQYTALTFNWPDFSQAMQTYLGYRWQQWGLLWLLVLAGLILRQIASSHPPNEPGEQAQDIQMEQAARRRWWLVILWAVVGLAIMLVQAKGYDYHWLPMLPPLALLAAYSIDRLTTVVGNLLPAARVLFNGVAAVGLLALMALSIWPKALPYLTGQEDQTTYYSRFVAGEFMADESLRVANFLRERVVPGDSLYIWGFRPEVYYLSQLNPATRFIFHFPLVAEWYPAEWRQENVDTLWAALPPYVLVLQVDYMPWVTGSHEDSNTLLQRYTELNNWLIFNYERETQIGNFFIWRRKTT